MRVRFLIMAFLLTAMLPLAGAAGSDWKTATLMNSGDTKSGQLSDRHTEDWYKFVVPEKKNGTATFVLSSKDGLSLNRLNVFALKDDEVKLRNQFVLCREVTGDTLTISDLAAGTYYVHITRYNNQGSYNLKYTFAPNSTPNDSEPNDQYDKGAQLESGKTATGHLGYYYLEDTRDTEDWYKFVVPEKKNGTATFVLSSKDGLSLSHLDVFALKDDEVKLRNQFVLCREVTGDTLTISELAAGTYYVHITRYNNQGSYNLKYTFAPNSTPNDSEPNNTYEQGELLTDGQTVTGNLGYIYYGEDTRDKEDWYKIEVSKKGLVLLSVKPDTLSTLDINSLALYQKNGDDLKKIAGTGVGKAERQLTVNDAEPGTYYVMVSYWSGTGGYSLTYGNPVPAMGSHISISVTGRNKVRLGVPCRYTMTIRNHSCNNTGSFIVSVCGTDDIKMLRAELPTNRGIQKLSMNDIGNEGDPVMWFVIPDLSPYEKYSFDFFVEGQDVTEPPFTTALVVGAIGSVVGGVVSDYASDYISEYASEKIELNETERQQYVQALGKAVEQSLEQKAKDGAVVFTAKSVLSTAAEKAMELFPGGSIVTKAGKTMDIISAVSTALRHRLYYWLYKEVGLINDGSSVLDGKIPADGVVASWDPNEKTGPKGYGEDNFLAKPQRMTYTIFFENKKEATAPAYRIRIEDTLADAFDPETVQFGPTSHSGNGYYWQMSRKGNKLTWDIEGIELPPNVNAPEGEGYVSFSVYLKDGVKNGDAIENKATVTFDNNKPIETNVWRNVIDTEAPATKMLPVSYVAGTDHVTVTCQSDDNKNGSGVNRYLFYVSKNGEPFAYFAETNEPKLEYPVDKSRTDTYGFYALAVDNVGNTEQTAPDAVIVNTQTSISDIVAECISVSPNPSEGIFRATLPPSVSELTVYTATGQMIWKASTSSLTGTVEINLTDHPAGVYLLRAVVDGKISTMKLIKK